MHVQAYRGELDGHAVGPVPPFRLTEVAITSSPS